MFGLWVKKAKPHITDELAATRESKVRHPVRKCPFMYPLVHEDQNELPIHLFYDCMRQSCQIWDGQNCSLHFEGTLKDRLRQFLNSTV